MYEPPCISSKIVLGRVIISSSSTFMKDRLSVHVPCVEEIEERGVKILLALRSTRRDVRCTTWKKRAAYISYRALEKHTSRGKIENRKLLL